MGFLQKLLDVEEKLRASLMFVPGNLKLFTVSSHEQEGSAEHRGWKPLCPRDI